MSTSLTVPSTAASSSPRKDNSTLATATRAGRPVSITGLEGASGSTPAARNAAG